MKYLFDTSALSDILRRHPKESFLARLRQIEVADRATSSVCIMELRYGCALKGDPALWARIEEHILQRFTVVAFGNQEAQRCGEILALLSKQGTPIGIEDTQIGATALEHGLTVVTANIRHFERIPKLIAENWLA
jgi:tRNA(fMet)-specific endonuclease VapC